MAHCVVGIPSLPAVCAFAALLAAAMTAASVDAKRYLMA
jgi:hypothetical protein